MELLRGTPEYRLSKSLIVSMRPTIFYAVHLYACAQMFMGAR